MKKVLQLVMIGLIAFVLVACGTSKEKEEKKGEVNETLTIKHELDETKVTKNPKDVVVFDYGTLDTLDKLGVEIQGTPQGNMPSYLKKYEDDKYENVGSLKEPDFDKLATIGPDLIIISGRQSPVYDELSKIAPTIYLGVDTERYMDSFKENLAIIGEIFDKEKEVNEEIDEIEKSIVSLKEKAEKVNKDGLIILANDDKISAYGKNSRFGIIHDVFGVPAVDDNIDASTHGANVNFEYVKEKDPDLLYVIDRSAAVDGKSAAQKLMGNKLMENTKAKVNDDIYYLDPDFWYLSGGGLISVTEMIKEIEASLD